MRLHVQQTLLVVVVSLFASAAVTFSAATEIEQAKGSTVLASHSVVLHGGTMGRRSLRAGKATDTEDESSELRGFWTNVKVRWWLETEKTDDYVMKALKVKGPNGEPLTNHKNYKAFQFFLKKSEEYKLNKWYRYEYSTYKGWQELGLDKKITLAKDLDKIRKTKEFKVYKHYVNYFDKYVLISLKAGYSPPKAMTVRGPSEAEMTARTEIMAEAGRPAKYAKLVLGLTDSAYPRPNLLTDKALEASSDFKYFKLFLEKKKPVIAEQLEKLKDSVKPTKLLSNKRYQELLEEMEWVKKYVDRVRAQRV